MLFSCGCTFLYSLSIIKPNNPHRHPVPRGLQGGSRLFPEVGFRTQRRCLYSLRCQRFRLWRAGGQEDGSSHHQVWRWSWCRAEHAGQFFVASVFSVLLMILEEEGCRERTKDTTQQSFFLFLFDLLEVNKHHFPHAISECVCCQSNWAGRPGIAITFWRFPRSLDHSHLRGQVDEFLRFMFCYVVPSMEHIK